MKFKCLPIQNGEREREREQGAAYTEIIIVLKEFVWGGFQLSTMLYMCACIITSNMLWRMAWHGMAFII